MRWEDDYDVCFPFSLPNAMKYAAKPKPTQFSHHHVASHHAQRRVIHRRALLNMCEARGVHCITAAGGGLPRLSLPPSLSGGAKWKLSGRREGEGQRRGKETVERLSHSASRPSSSSLSLYRRRQLRPSTPQAGEGAREVSRGRKGEATRCKIAH